MRQIHVNYYTHRTIQKHFFSCSHPHMDSKISSLFIPKSDQYFDRGNKEHLGSYQYSDGGNKEHLGLYQYFDSGKKKHLGSYQYSDGLKWNTSEFISWR